MTQDNLPNLSRYEDKEQISQRMQFYLNCDEYVQKHTTVYKVCILVHAMTSHLGDLKKTVENIVGSSMSEDFLELTLCNRSQVNDVMELQTRTHINLSALSNSMIYDKDDVHVVTYER